MSNNKDNNNIAEVKEKKPNKLKVWWQNNWGKVVGTAAAVAGTAGIVYFGKKGLDLAMDSHETNMLLKYGEASGLNLLEDSGSYCEKVGRAVAKIKEERNLGELNDTIKEKVSELSDLCKDKGVEVMLSATLGTDDEFCETDSYIGNLSIN